MRDISPNAEKIHQNLTLKNDCTQLAQKIALKEVPVSIQQEKLSEAKEPSKDEMTGLPIPRINGNVDYAQTVTSTLPSLKVDTSYLNRW